jgi:hypothetical protein
LDFSHGLAPNRIEARGSQLDLGLCVISFICGTHQWHSFRFFKPSTRLEGSVKGIMVAEATKLTHMLFVDDVLLFGDGTIREWRSYKHILETFCLATGMEINDNKSLILCNELFPEVEAHILHQYSFHSKPLDNGLKYLGYHLKPNDYRVVEWMWLFRKIEARITVGVIGGFLLVEGWFC